jgi:hypothetical protein
VDITSLVFLFNTSLERYGITIDSALTLVYSFYSYSFSSTTCTFCFGSNTSFDKTIQDTLFFAKRIDSITSSKLWLLRASAP